MTNLDLCAGGQARAVAGGAGTASGQRHGLLLKKGTDCNDENENAGRLAGRQGQPRSGRTKVGDEVECTIPSNMKQASSSPSFPLPRKSGQRPRATVSVSVILSKIPSPARAAPACPAACSTTVMVWLVGRADGRTDARQKRRCLPPRLPDHISRVRPSTPSREPVSIGPAVARFAAHSLARPHLVVPCAFVRSDFR